MTPKHLTSTLLAAAFIAFAAPALAGPDVDAAVETAPEVLEAIEAMEAGFVADTSPEGRLRAADVRDARLRAKIGESAWSDLVAERAARRTRAEAAGKIR